MATDGNIHSGLWKIYYDYDRSTLMRPQIVLTGPTSRYATSWLAVLLSLTMPCIFIWCRRAILVILKKGKEDVMWLTELVFRDGRSTDAYLENETSAFDVAVDLIERVGDQENPVKSAKLVLLASSDRVILTDDEEQSSSIWSAFEKWVRKSLSTIKTVCGSVSLLFPTIIVVGFFLALFGASIVVPIASANISGDSVVSAISDKAGLWYPDTSGAAFLLGEGSAIIEDRDSRIWAYKRACYDAHKDAPMCGVFYKPKIPFHSVSDSPCPFDGDVCLSGSQSAYLVSTGILDSSVLGVNEEKSKRFYFQRTMSCSPLLSDERYVSPSGSAAYPNEWLYNYGPYMNGAILEDRFTYRNPREWKLESEDMTDFTLAPSIYDPMASFATFYPLPEFRAGNSTVTILFISSAGEYYHVFESNDPVFPAHSSVSAIITPGHESTFWYNNSTKAGVLGCVDNQIICADADGLLCWDQSNYTDALHYYSGDLQRQRAFFLVQTALLLSDAWDVANYRRADMLNATHEAKRIIGVRLAEEQWKVEVDNIFAATLAGMQIRIYDFALGTYANHPSMIDRTPLILQDNTTNIRAAVDIAKMFKFRDSGYVNFSAVLFWGINTLCIIVFLGTRRFSTAERRAELLAETGDGGFHDCLWATIFWEIILVGLVKLLWRFVRNVVLFLWRGCRNSVNFVLLSVIPRVYRILRRPRRQRRGNEV